MGIDKLEKLEELIKKKYFDRDFDIAVIKKAGKGSIIIGRHAGHSEGIEKIVLRDSIILERDYGEKPYIHSQGWGSFKYAQRCSVPHRVYDELKEKLGKEGWPASKENNRRIKTFISTLTQGILAQPLGYGEQKEEFMEYYDNEIEQVLKEKDKSLKENLKNFKQKKPFLYLKTKNQIESNLIKKIETCNCMDSKKTRELEETIEFFSDTEIDTDALKKEFTVQRARMYSKRFAKQDKALPVELMEISEKEPELYLAAIKQIEQEIIRATGLAEIKNLNQAEKHVELVTYAQMCGVWSDSVQEKIKGMLNRIEQKTKEERGKELKIVRGKYKQKLREIDELKERIGTE